MTLFLVDVNRNRDDFELPCRSGVFIELLGSGRLFGGVERMLVVWSGLTKPVRVRSGALALIVPRGFDLGVGSFFKEVSGLAGNEDNVIFSKVLIAVSLAFKNSFSKFLD